MVIQCEKCKTRFKLDDSRITESGVRVRCSRCSHTFVVRREASEEDSDFESILQGLGGNEPSGLDAENVPPLGGFSTDKALEETSSLQSEEFVEDELSPDDFTADSNFSLDSLSWDEEELESELEPEQDELPEQSFSDLLGKGAGLPQFQTPADFDPSEKVPVAKDARGSSGLSSLFESSPVEGNQQVDDDSEVCASADSIYANDVPLESPLPGESEQPLPIREHIWPAADSIAEDGMAGDLSPLSISSSRKGSPYLPILLGILLVLFLAGAGFYFFTARSGGLTDFLPESAKAVLGLGKKAGGLVEIRSLEGTFLANREAGEIFVLKGDVFNVSSKPLTTIQVRGKVFGPKGEILVQQTVFCGNILSGEQLALQPYSSMVKVLNNQFGETLANFEVQPGKGIPFVIVFKDVPMGAKDFGAEVVSPAGSNGR